MNDALKSLPSVDEVLRLESTRRLVGSRDRGYVVEAVRSVLGGVRRELLEAGGSEVPSREELLARVETELAGAVGAGGEASLHRAINATGVILHTGLGRAPLPPAALAAVMEVGENYCNLEVDLETGERGSRIGHVERMICDASGAEAAVVVNNNAAAVLLLLNSLARGREVIVSRGELVEIGGAFRMPDIVAASGARLREVGTTNRTHPADYENALGEQTGAILAVHPSNYRVKGFTAAVGLTELAALAERCGVPLIYDLGGGVLFELEDWGLPPEPVVASSLRCGAGAVTFSGDKLLGGPQAGIIAGRAGLVRQAAANPLMRALRCDKLTLAALAATLRLYRLDPAGLRAAHPVLRMMTEEVAAVRARADSLVRGLSDMARSRLLPAVEATTAEFGSGALPLEELPSAAVCLRPTFCSAGRLARALRTDPAAVVGRIRKEAVLLDMRTTRDDEVAAVAACLERAASG